MEEFKVDLTNCDREPIHIPGKIQQHGFLLAYHAGTGKVQYASENLQAYTGTETTEVLGNTIQQYLSQQNSIELSVEQLDKLQQEVQANGSKTEHFIAIQVNGKDFNLVAHQSEHLIVLEFEPQKGDVPTLKLQDMIAELVEPLQAGMSLAGLLPLLAKNIKKLIQYDRVMVYKYWEDWHGEVVAEEKNDDLEPYLGLHYPASDIPKPARDLYMINLVRLISHISGTPSDVVAHPSIGKPLNLTHASLRAVSPMHIQYLQNMGVMASFSISLMYKGKLWGLIACHHYSPRFLDFETRQACKLLAQLLATTLNAKVEEELAIVSSNYKDEADKIFETLYRTGNIPQSLINNARSILKIGDASGAAIYFENKVYTIGETPSETEIKDLVLWISRNAPSRLYHTTSLPKFYSKALDYSHLASGVLALELFRNNHEYLLWFKPELNQTVKWAGNPNKPIEVDATGATRLTPRQSFAVWYQEVKNTSAPWERNEILTAMRLREGILQVISQKANETRKLNEKLKEAYDELDTFSHTISHDLRTPISIIKNYAEILTEEHATLPEAETKQMLQRIMAGADQMEKLIKEVLAYSRLSNIDASGFEEVDMPELLGDIVKQAQALTGKDMGVEILETPPITAPKVMVQQIFMNLIENAIKYTSRNSQPLVAVKGSRLENEIIYEIRDNGIGIDATHGDKVFMLFKRMDNAVDYQGTGIGLATVNRLVKKLGGRVWFESELNKGTVFFVTFPLN